MKSIQIFIKNLNKLIIHLWTHKPLKYLNYKTIEFSKRKSTHEQCQTNPKNTKSCSFAKAFSQRRTDARRVASRIENSEVPSPSSTSETLIRPSHGFCHSSERYIATVEEEEEAGGITGTSSALVAGASVENWRALLLSLKCRRLV